MAPAIHAAQHERAGRELGHPRPALPLIGRLPEPGSGYAILHGPATRASRPRDGRARDRLYRWPVQARAQARERIIREQKVANEEKILSLYEPDVQVIARKKAGAEYEFGNTLLLSENQQGVILDWKLFKDTAPNDARLVEPSLERTEQNLDIHVKAAAGDRGFASKSNSQMLKKTIVNWKK